MVTLRINGKSHRSTCRQICRRCGCYAMFLGMTTSSAIHASCTFLPAAVAPIASMVSGPLSPVVSPK
jgi:hypothetical protein